MPLSVSSSTISPLPESSALDQPKSQGSEQKPEVEHGVTESGPEHVNPDETNSFLEGYSTDHPTTSERGNPSTEQLKQNEMEMRKASDTSEGRQPGALEDHGTKFAFLPSHFQEGVVPGNNEESAKRLASMMPAPLSEGGHLERLMLEPDPAHAGSHKVDENTLYESAAALKYAQEKGYDLSSVGRHSATVDFHATNQEGKQVLFDPFGSPQMKEPSAKLQQLRSKVATLEEKEKNGSLTKKEEKELTKARTRLGEAETNFKQTPYTTTPGQWAGGAYTDHTNESKGDGVTGIWHMTATTHDQMKPLHDAAQNRTNVTADTPNNVQKIDLKLAEEFTKEDHQARQEMLGRINEGSTRPQSDASVDQEAQETFKRKATEFLS